MLHYFKSGGQNISNSLGEPSELMSFVHAAVIKMKTDCVLLNIGIPAFSNGSRFFSPR
jgi:hypothetical protein